MRTRIKLFLAACILVVMAACGTKSNKTVSLMPKDNVAVGQFNTQDLYQNLGADYTQQLKSLMTSALTRQQLPSEIMEVTEPVYFAANEQGLAFFAFEYGDSKKVETIKESIKKMAGSAVNSQEIGGYEFMYSERVAMAFVESGILLITNSQSNEKEYLVGYFQELCDGKYGSIQDNANFQKVQNSKSVMALSFSEFEKIQDLVAQTTGQSLPDIQDSKAQLEGKEIFMECVLEQNKVKLVVENNYDDSEVFKPISGDLNKYLAKDFALHLGLAIEDVEGMEVALNQILTLMPRMNSRDREQVQEMIKSAAPVLESLDGDAVLAVSNTSSMIPDVVLMAEVDSRAVIDEINKYADEMSRYLKVNEVEKDNFEANVVITNVYYGLKNGIFYLTNSKAVASAVIAGEALSENFGKSDFASKVDGSIGAFAIDAQQVMKHTTVQQALRRVNNNPLLKDLVSFEIVAKSVQQAEVCVELTDSQTPALQRVVDGLVQLR